MTAAAAVGMRGCSGIPILASGGKELLFIYGLVDPMTDELRYVGKSQETGTYKRPSAHAKQARKHIAMSTMPRLHVQSWLTDLIMAGSDPETVIIEDGCLDRDALREAETFWIAYYRSIGCRLTNMTDGGDGFHGKHTDASKQLISINCGSKRPEVREKIRSIMADPEIRKKCAKGSASRKGIPRHPVVIARAAEAVKVTMTTPEMRQKLRDAWVERRKTHDPLKASAAARGGWEKRRQRVNDGS